MFALAPRSRTYPVLLPDRPSTEREPARRRTRRRPLPTIMALAVVAVLPALALVAQRTEAARTGYVILGLRQQVEVLAAENAQLLATTSALRAPDRIERIARADLGMLTPRQQLEAIALDPHRGLIFDRRGRALAVNVDATSIYAVPSAIADRQAFAARVAPVLGQGVDEVKRRLASGRHFAWLARKVSPQLVARVRALGMADEIGFLTEDKRAYPNGPLAAQLIGFAGIDKQGLTGGEPACEHALHGTVGRAIAARDGRGRVMVETQQVLGTPQDGQDILLTIDQVIQHITERELIAAVERTGAKGGWAVGIDPMPGEILAMASVV